MSTEKNLRRVDTSRMEKIIMEKLHVSILLALFYTTINLGNLLILHS